MNTPTHPSVVSLAEYRRRLQPAPSDGPRAIAAPELFHRERPLSGAQIAHRAHMLRHLARAAVDPATGVLSKSECL